METFGDFRIPAEEISTRTGRLQEQMCQSGIDGLVVIQRVDLLYFSGTAQNAILYIPADGKPLLMVRKYYPRAVAESSLDNIAEIRSVREVPELITDYYGALPKTIAFEMDVMPVNDFNFYASLFPGSRTVDGSPMIMDLRIIKSAWEIEQMRRTAALSHLTFNFMREAIQPGLTEMECAGIVEAFSRKHGHAARVRVRNYQAEVYPWHLISGKNSAVLGLIDSPASGMGTSVAFPCGAGWKKLVANEPIMFDFSTILNGYHIDETRMFAITAMPPKALDLCKTAIDIHNGVIEKTGPGMTAHEVYEISLALARQTGCKESYLGPSGYKVSFVGHGVGMELVEPPYLADGKRTVLKPGMTFALEPKLVKKDEFMAGIESVFEVTESGARLLTTVPAEVFIC